MHNKHHGCLFAMPASHGFIHWLLLLSSTTTFTVSTPSHHQLHPPSPPPSLLQHHCITTTTTTFTTKFTCSTPPSPPLSLVEHYLHRHRTLFSSVCHSSQANGISPRFSTKVFYSWS